MKKKNLKLNDLKVQSFVTSLNDDGAETLKGGSPANTNFVTAACCIASLTNCGSAGMCITNLCTINNTQVGGTCGPGTQPLPTIGGPGC